MGFGSVSGRWWYDETLLPLEGYCCPLPEGTLLNEHQLASDRCPDGFIVTGGVRRDPPSAHEKPGWSGKEIPASRYFLWCTKLNDHLYRLSSPTAGWSIGWVKELFF